jgi:hypothetical protein
MLTEILIKLNEIHNELNWIRRNCCINNTTKVVECVKHETNNNNNNNNSELVETDIKTTDKQSCESILLRNEVTKPKTVRKSSMINVKK